MKQNSNILRLIRILGSILGYWFLIYVLNEVREKYTPTILSDVMEKIILSLYSFGILGFSEYRTSIKKVRGNKPARIFFLILVGLLLTKFVLNIVSGLMMPNYQVNTIGNIILAVIYFCLIGFAEEVLFRGYILNELLAITGKYKAYLALIVNGILFGLFHLINAIYGRPYQQVLIQIISASVIGVVYAAVYLYSDSIWVAIALHTLFNVAAGFYRWIFYVVGSAADLQFFWIKIVVNALFYVMGIVVVVIYLVTLSKEKVESRELLS